MNSPTRPDVSILVVSWNTADLLERCVRSVREHVALDHEVFVIDNASSDDSVERIRRAHPEVRLLVQDDNTGFARANNRALAEATGDFVLLLNPDAEVLPGAVEDLVEFLRNEPGVGIAGPPYWNADGSPQMSTSPFPSVREEFLRQTMLYRWFDRDTRHATTERDVEQVSGAALMIRRECLEQIGPLDDRIFMFYEDTDWCRRAWDAGWRVAFRPGPGIRHVRGGSLGRARTRTLLASHRSAIYYFSKHGSRASRVGLRLVTAVGSTVRIARASLEWLVGNERSDQVRRLAAYARIWRWAVFGLDLGSPGQPS